MCLGIRYPVSGVFNPINPQAIDPSDSSIVEWKEGGDGMDWIDYKTRKGRDTSKI